MSCVIVDIAGRVFGHWTVLREGSRDPWGQVKWLARCVCGVERELPSARLRVGGTTSCGCRKSAACAIVNVTHGATQRGTARPPEYGTWAKMIERCERPANRAYPNYGGRGIKVYAGWRHDFAAFFEYVGPRPSPAHTLDRIENDGHYEPGNVRWATRTEQNQNRRSTRHLSLNGETACIAEWSRRTGISSTTLLMRIDDLGWPVDRALTTPVRRASGGA